MPRISVILPVLNGKASLVRAVKSIQAQTIQDWELFIINEYGSVDGTAELVKQLAANDSRIYLFQNEVRLGLAESINFGMRTSTGEFIARMDADDVSMPTRFEKQLALFNAHPEVGICGTWQRHIHPQGTWVHRPPADTKHLCASLLFSCELCHSTVMMRRAVVWSNNLFYQSQYHAEDYELWTRALAVTKLANVPDVLGEYRYGDNITMSKMSVLQEEHGRLSAAALYRTLHISVISDQFFLLNTWSNPFKQEKNSAYKHTMLADYKGILLDVWNANQKIKFFEDTALLDVLRARWLWASCGLQDTRASVRSIEGVFVPISFPRIRLGLQILRRNRNLLMLFKKLWNRMESI